MEHIPSNQLISTPGTTGLAHSGGAELRPSSSCCKFANRLFEAWAAGAGGKLTYGQQLMEKNFSYIYRPWLDVNFTCCLKASIIASISQSSSGTGVVKLLWSPGTPAMNVVRERRGTIGNRILILYAKKVRDSRKCSRPYTQTYVFLICARLRQFAFVLRKFAFVLQDLSCKKFCHM